MSRFFPVDHRAARPLARRAVARTLALLTPGAVCLLWQLAVASNASAGQSPEYRLKAAVLYNFAQSTTWPATVGPTITLCVPWQDPFGRELDALQDKAVGPRRIAVQRGASTGAVKDCNLVFIPASAMGDLPQILDELARHPVLTVAESPGAAAQGVALNMTVAQNRITFEANVRVARAAGLELSSELLRLATDVIR